MKQGHFALFFLLIVVSFFAETYMEQERYREAEKEKERIEESLLASAERTAEKMKSVMEEETDTKLYTLGETFFESWYILLGIAGNEEEQEKMQLHIPMLAWLEAEGGYFFYTERAEEDGRYVLKQKWSGCIPYTENEVSLDREQLALYLEKNASGIITEHNRIAQQYGIQHSFFVPYFLTDREAQLSFPILLVVFQGWPLEGSSGVLYENCIDAGAYIREAEKYIVEQKEKSYAYFHQENCRNTAQWETVLPERLSKEEAQTIYGAVPCPYCFDKWLRH